MAITMKDVEYVAKLARMELTKEEKKMYSKQLGDILNYINKLNELDTSDIKPTSHVVSISNVFREDEINRTRHKGRYC